jgi:hypothetical protein
MPGIIPILVALIFGVIIYTVIFCLIFGIGKFALVLMEPGQLENTSEPVLTMNNSVETLSKG